MNQCQCRAPRRLHPSRCPDSNHSPTEQLFICLLREVNSVDPYLSPSLYCCWISCEHEKVSFPCRIGCQVAERFGHRGFRLFQGYSRFETTGSPLWCARLSSRPRVRDRILILQSFLSLSNIDAGVSLAHSAGTITTVLSTVFPDYFRTPRSG